MLWTEETSQSPMGQQDDAEWEIEQVLVLDPEYTTTKYESMARIAKEDELKRFLDDLRKAGLPDWSDLQVSQVCFFLELAV